MNTDWVKNLPKIREIVLHRMVKENEIRIPMEHFEHARYRDEEIYETYRHLFLSIQMSVLADHETVQPVKYPADWWQHFKLRWFPKWAKKRWPVRFSVTEFVATHVYPQLTTHYGKQYASVLKVMVREKSSCIYEN